MLNAVTGAGAEARAAFLGLGRCLTAATRHYQNLPGIDAEPVSFTGVDDLPQPFQVEETFIEHFYGYTSTTAVNYRESLCRRLAEATPEGHRFQSMRFPGLTAASMARMNRLEHVAKQFPETFHAELPLTLAQAGRDLIVGARLANRISPSQSRLPRLNYISALFFNFDGDFMDMLDAYTAFAEEHGLRLSQSVDDGLFCRTRFYVPNEQADLLAANEVRCGVLATFYNFDRHPLKYTDRSLVEKFCSFEPLTPEEKWQLSRIERIPTLIREAFLSDLAAIPSCVSQSITEYNTLYQLSQLLRKTGCQVGAQSFERDYGVKGRTGSLETIRPFKQSAIRSGARMGFSQLGPVDPQVISELFESGNTISLTAQRAWHKGDPVIRPASFSRLLAHDEPTGLFA